MYNTYPSNFDITKHEKKVSKEYLQNLHKTEH